MRDPIVLGPYWLCPIFVSSQMFAGSDSKYGCK